MYISQALNPYIQHTGFDVWRVKVERLTDPGYTCIVQLLSIRVDPLSLRLTWSQYLRPEH